MAKTRERTICDALKQVRQQIADANGIVYSPRECKHEGECRGTCPACEAEVRWLEDSLLSRYGRAFAQKVAGVAVVAGALTTSACTFSDKNKTTGEAVPEKAEVDLNGTGALRSVENDSVQKNVETVAPPTVQLQGDVAAPVEREVIKVGEVSQEELDSMMSKRKMPSFVGGNAALMEYIKDNLQYPSECYNNGIQGRVVVGFTVTKEGKLKDVSVVRSVDPLLDKEALRVVKSMPDWIPGKLNGEPVDVKYNIPITFRL